MIYYFLNLSYWMAPHPPTSMVLQFDNLKVCEAVLEATVNGLYVNYVEAQVLLNCSPVINL